MEAEPGLCFIFHNYKFDNHASLPKSFDIVNEEYEKALNENFLFSIRYENLSSELIVDTISDVEKNDEYYNYSRFKFVFVTHAGRNQETSKSVIFGSDSKPLNVDYLVDLLDDVKCTNLRGKHKAFHFFTCDCVYPPVEEKHMKTGFIEIGNRLHVVENVVRDMIKMWSTVDGFVSYREKGSGSYFINSLCDAITEHNETKGVMEILQKVQMRVDNYNRDGTQVTELQMIEFKKKFYFPSATQIRRNELLDWYAYEMKRPSAGTCLIININKYEVKKKIRYDSEIDVANLEKVFRNLTYNVITATDLTAHEIEEKIEDTLKHHTNDIDSFVLILMAHGNTRHNGSVVIFGVDGHQVNINNVAHLFNERDCSNLRGKPKLLIVNCCRGNTDLKINKRNVATECLNADKELETDFWDYNEKYKTKSLDSQIRDTLYFFGGGVINATMREMIVGTQIAEHLLQNLMTMRFQVTDLEFTQIVNLLEIIYGMVNHGLPSEHSAIGLRKIIYPFRLFGDHKSILLPGGPKRLAIIVDNSIHGATFSIEHHMIILKKLNFKIVYLQNQTKEEILNVAVEYKSNDELHKYDCLIFFYVGRVKKIEKHNIIFGFDGRKVNAKQLMHMFNDDNCPSLKGKPKIFRFEGNEMASQKAENRSDDEISLCKDMERIFEAPMDLFKHLSGGCTVFFHTPFAVFETKNDYLNQESYIDRTQNNFSGIGEQAMNFLVSSALTNTQSNPQNNSSDDLLNTILDSAFSLVSSEIKQNIMFDCAENTKSFKYPSDDVEQYALKYYYYEFRETLYSFSKSHHRDRKSQPNTKEPNACYCQWSSN